MLCAIDNDKHGEQDGESSAVGQGQLVAFALAKGSESRERVGGSGNDGSSEEGSCRDERPARETRNPA